MLSVIWQDQEGTPPDFVGLARGLCERSLLTARSDRTFLLHRLSLELERRRTPRPERFLWDSRVAEVLSTVVPKETVDVRNWPRLVLLQPHASDLFLRTEPLVPTTAFPAGDTRFASHLSTLLSQFGLFLPAKAEFSAAKPLLRRALAIVEKNLGEEHTNVGAALNNLASLLQATNRLEAAEPLMRRALAINEQSYGPEHPRVAIGLSNLAHLLQATHRLEEAEPLIRRALEIDEQSYGPEHPDVARDLNNLACLLQDTNRLQEAEPLSRRALAIFLDVTGRTGHPHPRLDAVLANYTGILRDLGRSEADIQAELGALQGQVTLD